VFHKELRRRLRALSRPEPPDGLSGRLERSIPDRFSERGWWGAGRIQIMTRVGLATAGAAVLIWGAVSLFTPGMTRSSWAQVLETVRAASGEVPCVHLVQQVRTREGEEFSFVEMSADPQKEEAWICWPTASGDPGRMRVEKADRIYSFDGRETIWYRPRIREASRYDGGSPRLQEYWPAAWLERLIDLPAKGAEVVTQEETAAGGRLVLHWEAPELNGLPASFFDQFEREVEVDWDPASHRLTGLRRWVYRNGARELFSELVSIDYPPAISETVFQVIVPPDVRWTALGQAPEALAALGSRETAERFWRAAIEGDWGTVSLLCPYPSIVDYLKTNRPVELIRLGEPISNGTYPGVYVPYTVRYAEGARPQVREHRVALRKDNDQHRWVVDGGV
jgi:hypothetical protein